MPYTPQSFVNELRERGVKRIRAVRFKDNRRTLLSVSRDGRTLNAHRCFQRAPGRIMDAIAGYLMERRTSLAFREALRELRTWPGAIKGLRESSMSRPSIEGWIWRTVPCVAADQQRRDLIRLYRRFNRTRFGGRLPENIPLRFSDRMLTQYGHICCLEDGDGERYVSELALNLDLALRGNERHLADTLLHEMAHIEAWLEHGDRGHGLLWKRIAERVGCEPTACCERKLRRRSRGSMRKGPARRRFA